MDEEIIKVSPLPKTWIFDIDGTILKHNGYKIDGKDSLLQNSKEFFEQISKQDLIILITSRSEEFKESTEKFLKENRIRYDHIIYNVPYGERIIINDKKPSGLATAIAINTERDKFCNTKFIVDESL
ncbi:HAD family acid phosphatase [Clostridium felsineum]|uniref:HAD family acid phosphatase n=1 Tax=Clostridium felsineum TaxID=36839 RepID=UPI00214D6F27|nr:HAD family acid phosphatase [Clostridium felsineum]MCR3757799.1 HAD family acid phosphatase [Clostridium felsineum]